MESIVEDEHKQFDEQQKKAEAPPAQSPSRQWLLSGIGRRALAIDVPFDSAQGADDQDCGDDEQDHEHGGWWFVVGCWSMVTLIEQAANDKSYYSQRHKLTRLEKTGMNDKSKTIMGKTINNLNDAQLVTSHAEKGLKKIPAHNGNAIFPVFGQTQNHIFVSRLNSKTKDQCHMTNSSGT